MLFLWERISSRLPGSAMTVIIQILISRISSGAALHLSADVLGTENGCTKADLYHCVATGYSGILGSMANIFMEVHY